MAIVQCPSSKLATLLQGGKFLFFDSITGQKDQQ